MLYENSCFYITFSFFLLSCSEFCSSMEFIFFAMETTDLILPHETKSQHQILVHLISR